MILVLNCGSQSIKWKLFDSKLKPVKEGKREVLNSGDFQNILEEELAKLHGSEITKIGHRVVHGGEKLVKPTEVTDTVLQELKDISPLAPLHNPYNIMGIETCRKIFPNAPNFAVFDTQFFANLPEVARIYAVAENVAREFGFRRYGFQGISHEYAASAAGKAKKIITAHLGGGASIAAVKNGVAVDTSMGFTPMEGLVMMTRPGNVDAGIVLQMCKKYGAERAEEILNKESGLKGICGESNMLTLLEKIKQGDEKAKLALDIFVYSIKKYIGAYFAILGGCDVLVFTGAIGANSAKIRNMVLKDMDFLKKTKILAIQTNEELLIAQKI